MTELYKKIITELTSSASRTTYTEHGVKPTKLVDEYEGQYFNPENYEFLNPPFCLVEYDVDHSTTTPSITLTLHLGYEQVKRANSFSNDIDVDLLFHKYTDAVHEIVSMIETEKTGKPELVSEGSLKEPAITKIHTLTYELSYSGRPKIEREIDNTNATLEIDQKDNPFKGQL